MIWQRLLIRGRSTVSIDSFLSSQYFKFHIFRKTMLYISGTSGSCLYVSWVWLRKSLIRSSGEEIELEASLKMSVSCIIDSLATRYVTNFYLDCDVDILILGMNSLRTSVLTEWKFLTWLWSKTPYRNISFCLAITFVTYLIQPSNIIVTVSLVTTDNLQQNLWNLTLNFDFKCSYLESITNCSPSS